jgi:integrase
MAKRANGEGTIQHRKDGRWEGRVYVLMPNGGRVRRTVYGRTRKEVHEKVTKLVRQAQEGVVAPNSKLTVERYLTEWLANVAKRSVRPSTYRAYEMFVRVHIVPAIGRKRLDALSAPEVRRLVNAKLDSGLSLASVRKMHAVLRAALEQAVRDDLLIRNVAKLVRLPVPRSPEIQVFTVDEARQVLDASSGHRLHAVWVLLLSMGFRKGECLGLRWSDVDLDEGSLRVRTIVQRVDGVLVLVEPKTPKSRRTIPLPAVCVSALREHRRRQAVERLKMGPSWLDLDMVFPTSVGTLFDPDNLNRELDKLCAKAGVPRIRVHDLRHTCATFLLTQGVPLRVVMEILGHSQISVTANTYTHVASALQRDAMDRMHDLFGDPVDVSVVVNPDSDPDAEASGDE